MIGAQSKDSWLNNKPPADDGCGCGCMIMIVAGAGILFGVVSLAAPTSTKIAIAKHEIRDTMQIVLPDSADLAEVQSKLVNRN